MCRVRLRRKGKKVVGEEEEDGERQATKQAAERQVTSGGDHPLSAGSNDSQASIHRRGIPSQYTSDSSTVSTMTASARNQGPSAAIRRDNEPRLSPLKQNANSRLPHRRMT